MMRARVTAVLYALVLALASCGPVATHARPVPTAAGGVIGIPPDREMPTDGLAQNYHHSGRALSAEIPTLNLPYASPMASLSPL